MTLRVSRLFNTYWAAAGYGIRRYGQRGYTIEWVPTLRGYRVVAREF